MPDSESEVSLPGLGDILSEEEVELPSGIEESDGDSDSDSDGSVAVLPGACCSKIGCSRSPTMSITSPR